MTETPKYYAHPGEPMLGYYEINQSGDKYHWTWTEVSKGVVYKDDGRHVDSRAAALRDAADDWESNGDSSNRKLAGMLRGLATRAEKPES